MPIDSCRSGAATSMALTQSGVRASPNLNGPYLSDFQVPSEDCFEIRKSAPLHRAIAVGLLAGMGASLSGGPGGDCVPFRQPSKASGAGAVRRNARRVKGLGHPRETPPPAAPPRHDPHPNNTPPLPP